MTPAPQPTTLIPDHKRPVKLCGDSLRLESVMARDQFEPLQALADVPGATEQTLIVAAFALLLSRHGDEGDLTLAVIAPDTHAPASFSLASRKFFRPHLFTEFTIHKLSDAGDANRATAGVYREITVKSGINMRMVHQVATDQA